MIKKIVCPIDFSDSSINASEYAAKLAQTFNAELIFLNVQTIHPIMAAVSLNEGIGTNERENSKAAENRLKEMSIEANRMFKIPVDYEVDLSSSSLVRILSAQEKDESLIVMGTNGTDDPFQNFFGTNTYNVIKKTNCPVLIVPENVTFGSIKKIVSAWDHNSKSNYSLSPLNDFIKAFDPALIFLHIGKKLKDLDPDDQFRNQIRSELETNSVPEFEELLSDDIPESINSFMEKSKADIVCLTFYDHGWIGNIFRGSVAKKLIETPDYPILVLHA